MSNLLAMPLVSVTVETGNNEDWLDTLKYVSIEEGVEPDEDTPQVDLRGIKFEMEMRRERDDHEVVLSASTDDGSISVGAPPNVGFLIIFIKNETMKGVKAGSYVADIVGRDEQYARKVIEMAITIVEGVTKWPSPA